MAPGQRPTGRRLWRAKRDATRSHGIGRKALLASHATPWAQSPTAQEAPTSASPQTGPAQSAEAARSLTSPPPTPAPRPRATPSLAATSIRRSTTSAPATPSASRSATFSPDPQTRSHESATDATQPFGMMRHARSLRAATASAAPRRAAAPHLISSTRASLPPWQGPLAAPPPRRGGRRLPEGKKRCRGGQTRKTAGFARPCKRGQDAYDISPCTDGAKAAERPGIHERRPCEGPQETRQRCASARPCRRRQAFLGERRRGPQVRLPSMPKVTCLICVTSSCRTGVLCCAAILLAH